MLSCVEAKPSVLAQKNRGNFRGRAKMTSSPRLKGLSDTPRSLPYPCPIDRNIRRF